MNYIILNGINSKSINGLLIQELPSISKPSKRTVVEEIDGRDGDLITELGYASYDKIISIGLHDNYDIDRIIEFFNSSGQVIFSNETDKYYNYQIYEQINFERLMRFRTATITMHVQPFKYSSIEKKRVFNIQNEEKNIQIKNSGNCISKPIISISGTDTINFYLNGKQIFVIDLDNENNLITIDTNLFEAYNPLNKVLMNRLVSGNYDNFFLNKGINNISWTGNISKIEIENYSRWI